MTTSRKTKDLIAEAEATEAALMAIWDELKGTLTPSDEFTQKLAGGGEALRRGAQSAATSATTTAKAHPIAAAALAAGVAWLIFGGKRTPAKETAEEATAKAAEAWKARAIAARDRAQHRLEESFATLRSEAGKAAEDVAEAGSAKLSEASKLAQKKATITADLAQELSDAFHHGLSSFGEDAKERILKAREQSFASLMSASGRDESMWHKGQTLARRNPLQAAALGLAAGIGVAWLMPRTRAALQAAAPGAVGAVITPAAALVAQNLMAKASRLMDPFVSGEAEKDAEEPADKTTGSQTVKDAAKAAAVAGVAKAVGEAIGKAGAARAEKAASSQKSATEDDAESATSAAAAKASSADKGGARPNGATKR